MADIDIRKKREERAKKFSCLESGNYFKIDSDKSEQKHEENKKQKIEKN